MSSYAQQHADMYENMYNLHPHHLRLVHTQSRSKRQAITLANTHRTHTHITSHKTHSTEHNRGLLSISACSATVQTIQFSTMHLICPSGLVRIPNHFNSLLKLAKHFLISLNTATAQCRETKLYLWRITKMESRAAHV